MLALWHDDRVPVRVKRDAKRCPRLRQLSSEAESVVRLNVSRGGGDSQAVLAASSAFNPLHRPGADTELCVTEDEVQRECDQSGRRLEALCERSAHLEHEFASEMA